MKTKTITSLLLTASLTTIATLSNLSQVQAQEVELACGTSFNTELNKKVPTTLATAKNTKLPLIQWVKQLGSWTPQERCNKVSSNLQKAHQEGTLKFLTNGKQNKQNVICAATEYGGTCKTMIMTLRPEDEPKQFLAELKEALNGRTVGAIEHSSGFTQTYIEVNLEEALKNSR